MSAFDKVVAEWLNGVGESLPRSTKQDILTGIKDNIERYKAMDDTMGAPAQPPQAAAKPTDDTEAAAAAATHNAPDGEERNVPPGAPHTATPPSQEQQQEQEGEQPPQQQQQQPQPHDGDAAAVSADTNRDDSATSANDAGRVLDGIAHNTLHATPEAAADEAIGASVDAAVGTDEHATAEAAAAAAATSDSVCANDRDTNTAADDNNNNEEEEGQHAAAPAPPHGEEADEHVAQPQLHHDSHHHLHHDPYANHTDAAPTHQAPAETVATPLTSHSATRRAPSLFTIDTSKIDFAFEESVDAALRRLEEGKTDTPLFGPETSEATTTTTTAAATEATPPNAPRDADDVDTTTREQPDDTRDDDDHHHHHHRSSSSGSRNRNEEDDDNEREAGRGGGGGGEDAAAADAPAAHEDAYELDEADLADVRELSESDCAPRHTDDGDHHHHHHDEPHSHSDAEPSTTAAEDSTAAKVAAMHGFVFGRPIDEPHHGDDGHDAELHNAGATASRRDSDSRRDGRAATPTTSDAPHSGGDHHHHHHDDDDAQQQQQRDDDDDDAHPTGGGDVLDEREDARRRRAQLEHSNPRIAVSDEPLSLAQAMTTHFATSPKSQAQSAVLTRALERHFLFSALDDADIERCAAIMPVREYDAGSHILRRGSANDELRLILSGTAEMVVPRSSGGSSSSDHHHHDHYHDHHDDHHDDKHHHHHHEATAKSPADEVLQLGEGDTFGDLGILYECVNDMDVRATAPLRCATIDRKTYKLFVSRAAEERRTRYAALLRRVPFLSSLPQHDLLRVAEALKEACYTQGDTIIAYGTANQWLHVIVEGTVDVVGRDDAGAATHVATLHPGDHAGHLECLYHHLTVADVVAASPRVRTAKLSRRQFDRLLGDSTRTPLRRDAEEGGSYAYYRATMRSASRPREDTTPAFDEPPCYLVRALHDHEERAHAQSPHDEQAGAGAAAEATVYDDTVDAAVAAAATEAAAAAAMAAQDERDVAYRDEL